MGEEKKKILVVEDEQDVQMYLTALLQDNGYETILADNGVKGNELAISEKPDLITLDISMPDQSGIRTYRNYKNSPETKDIPVVIITAIGESVNSFFKKLAGFPIPEGFMTKPINEGELISIVSDLLSG